MQCVKTCAMCKPARRSPIAAALHANSSRHPKCPPMHDPTHLHNCGLKCGPWGTGECLPRHDRFPRRNLNVVSKVMLEITQSWAACCFNAHSVNCIAFPFTRKRVLTQPMNRGNEKNEAWAPKDEQHPTSKYLENTSIMKYSGTPQEQESIWKINAGIYAHHVIHA